MTEINPYAKIKRPQINIKLRTFHRQVHKVLIENKVDSFIASIIARRVDDPEYALKLARLKLNFLTSPHLLKDATKAAKRIIQGLEKGEIIGLETDHDCDGQTSHAVLYEALTKLFNHSEDKIRSYIGHRMAEGYGLSEALANRILADERRPSLIITADNGSTDETRILLLKSQGIDVIVTDHHAIPEEGVPKSAYAVLNPTQKGCEYGDPYIAGCMVAWLLMAEVRRLMMLENKILNSRYQLTDLLDFVAVGTVADCVSMAKSINNRAVAYYGMQKISRLSRSCWHSFSDYFHHKVNSEFLGFVIAPLLNSDGRMSDALSSVSFLLNEQPEKTGEWVEFLQQQNQKRKVIQKEMTEKAMIEASKQYQKGRSGICVYLDDGHAGVHGISASRIKDSFGLPTILFSPKQGETEMITGSARSIDGLNIKHILDQIAQNSNDILLKYGGHTGAAGLTIYKDRFTEFCDLFDHYCQAEIGNNSIQTGPVIYCDGELSSEELTLNQVEKFAELEPFGREFEVPVFFNQAEILTLKWVGQASQHLQLILNIEGKSLKSVWFFANEYLVDNTLVVGDKVQVAYRLSKEHFNGETYLSLKIVYLSPLAQMGRKP
ncbi:DHH family phosphoesterase [Caedibacter taeniospiralis]|jgi:single-stranded-DNA-specific exonuclease|uniref:DHH family phosphoesterase n=1 Tax=Caedibacter taeniospiralis TaxID=28907 RepID=UPI0037C1212F